MTKLIVCGRLIDMKFRLMALFLVFFLGVRPAFAQEDPFARLSEQQDYDFNLNFNPTLDGSTISVPAENSSPWLTQGGATPYVTKNAVVNGTGQVNLGDEWALVGNINAVYVFNGPNPYQLVSGLADVMPYNAAGLAVKYGLTSDLSVQGGIDHYQFMQDRSLNGLANMNVMSVGVRVGF
jgi:hypothetical protein